MKTFLEGWKLILEVLWSVIKALLKSIELLLEIFLGRKEKGRLSNCFNRPNLRARPDPYIYSQQWLYLRGIAYTWDNPDFTIIDPDTGLSVDNHHLLGGKLYHIHATIHNSSIMAALGTTVAFEVLHFGAGTTVIQGLGSVSVGVPALGDVVAEIDWTTPPTAGHNCLRAIISHPDDANPLNNIGQHNTDVATPASPTNKLKFYVGNHFERERTYDLTMNSYRLPDAPLVPRRGEARGERGNPSRRSLEYLKLFQERNDFAKFPVPEFLQAKLEHVRLSLKPGEEFETFVEMTPPKAGQGRQVINVNVLHDNILVGGVTAYIEEV